MRLFWIVFFCSVAASACLTGCGDDNSDKIDAGPTDTDMDIDTDTDADTGTDAGSDADTDVDAGADAGDDDGVVIGAEWTAIPAGSLWIGSPDGACPEDYPGGVECVLELGRLSNEDLHYVQLTNSFKIMRTEVSQGDFAAVIGWNPSYFGPNNEGGDCGDDCPAEYLSWYDAAAFANELSLDRGLTPCYTMTSVTCEDATNVGADYMGCMNVTQKGIDSALVALNGVSTPYECEGYRLPTESEWEYAARAGTLTAFYNGGITNTLCSPLDANLDAAGWYCGNSHSETCEYSCVGWYTGATTCGPQPVAGKAPNTWGLYDMSGNVWEWTWDWYQPAYPEGNASFPVIDPVGPESTFVRVARGGNWYFYADAARSGSRYGITPADRNYYLGFRLLRSL